MSAGLCVLLVFRAGANHPDRGGGAGVEGPHDGTKGPHMALYVGVNEGDTEKEKRV